ncbi:hypothetical protein Taro_036190 [Colocasia esculenta]|uniref:Uncharacterized protein n=1 Tax=Colocasia esculenta TaxID=4460 RepID=A0A843W2F1_COLES|nr:hypothetical protein [Colocasia esculenta]
MWSFTVGVLRPVPKQQLRILLTRVQSPYGQKQHPAQLVFLHKKGTITPWIPTRSSFTTEGNKTPWLPTRSSFTTEGNNNTKNKQEFKPLDQALASQDLKLLALRANNLDKALSQHYISSLRISITAWRAKS